MSKVAYAVTKLEFAYFIIEDNSRTLTIMIFYKF